jgi:hypothetical protein
MYSGDLFDEFRVKPSLQEVRFIALPQEPAQLVDEST